MSERDLREEIAQIFDRARAEALALLDGKAGPDHELRRGLESNPRENTDPPEWHSLQRAAAACGVHADTLAARCRKYGLGHRAGGGPWLVDMARVRAWTEGRPYDRLTTETREDSAKPGIVPNASGDSAGAQ